MTVLVASDDPRIAKLFSPYDDGKKSVLIVVARTDFTKKTKLLGDELVFAWYDLTALEGAGLKSALRNLGKLPVPWGLIDRKGVLEDASEAFWAGASDYIGPRSDLSSIGAKRLKKALEWARRGAVSDLRTLPVSISPAAKAKAGAPAVKAKKKPVAVDPPRLREAFIDSSTGWNSIKEGRSYTFTFVYVQIDKAEKLLETLGEKRLDALDQEFHRMIEHVFAKSGALVWMWRDYGGLLLLPFDGKDCPAILEAFNLWLNRPILYAGNAALSVGFSFRMAIHIGNTVFRRPGQTGDLTSDALNSIFHLGSRFMKNDTLYLTDEAALFIPPKIAELFVNAGTYDGRAITRMRSFL